MKHTWNNIEDQIQSSRNEIDNILNSTNAQDLEISGWKSHKTAIAMASFGLVLLVASFMLPSKEKTSFKADLINGGGSISSSDLVADANNPFLSSNEETEATKTEENTVSDEAEDIEVAPLTKTDNPFVNTTPEPTTETTPTTPTPVAVPANPFVNTTPEPTTETTPTTPTPVTVPANPFLPSTPETSSETIPAEPVNPFASLKDPVPTPEINMPTAIETEILHGTPTGEDLFKENTHTYDKVDTNLPSNDGALADPLGEVATDIESVHGVSSIVKQNLVASTSGGTLYTGIIKSGGTNSNPRIKYPFTYQLLLDDNSLLRIDTQRDLRNVIGKEITIEISGNKDKFTLLHVYYNPQNSRNLAQSGPGLMLFITGLLALFLAKITYRRLI